MPFARRQRLRAGTPALPNSFDRMRLISHGHDDPSETSVKAGGAGFVAHQTGQPIVIFQMFIEDGLAGAHFDHFAVLIGAESTQGRPFDARHVTWPLAVIPSV